MKTNIITHNVSRQRRRAAINFIAKREVLTILNAEKNEFGGEIKRKHRFFDYKFHPDKSCDSYIFSTKEVKDMIIMNKCWDRLLKNGVKKMLLMRA